jgi:hypothetical protein
LLFKLNFDAGVSVTVLEGAGVGPEVSGQRLTNDQGGPEAVLDGRVDDPVVRVTCKTKDESLYASKLRKPKFYNQ